MAQTIKDEEERKKRIILVGNLFKETGLSTRKLAAYITDNFFPISNCTVSDYMKRYMKLKPNEIATIREKIFDNTPNNISKKDVKNRVMQNADLFEHGYTIDEIATATKTSFWVVYRDITSRLKIFDEERYNNSIKPKLTENRHRNLENKNK